MELNSIIKSGMPDLIHTEFTALLARARLSQAGFARLTGVTARQINNWCRGRAAAPRWAALLAITLDELTPAHLEARLLHHDLAWHEILGVPPYADSAAIRQAWTALARRYHPDAGGSAIQMARINAAYDAAR
jgi:transcriptional regulator with XRE-family HTH domain